MGLEKSSLMVKNNMSVISNTIIPSSMLKRKHNAVVYHRVKEAIASKMRSFCYLLSTVNIADVLTKLLSREIFHGLLRQYMYREPIVHDVT